MTSVVVMDFLSDPMGGLLTSAVSFLDRVRQFDKKSHLIVLENNGSVSSRIKSPEDFDWINLERRPGLSGWQRIGWQNLRLPAIVRRVDAGVYVSLSHYLPRTLPANLKSIIGISNLAPFSKEAYAAEVDWRKKLRLKLLSRTIVSAAHRADRVIALSYACQAEMVIRGIAQDKIFVIPNGVEQSVAKHELQSRLQIEDEYILCVSHFYRYKNFERLLRAYALLPDALRARYKLILAGAPYDQSYFESVRALVSSLRLDSRVNMLPGVYGKALTELYRHCAVFAFPSLIENSPITLLEAMKNGAAVVAADIPAMREFGGSAVVYFDPLSVESISRSIEMILTDGLRRSSLRLFAQDRARLYDWDSFSRKLVNLYRGVLD